MPGRATVPASVGCVIAAGVRIPAVRIRVSEALPKLPPSAWLDNSRRWCRRDLHHPRHRGKRDHARAASPDANDLGGGGIRALALQTGCPARPGTRRLARDAADRSPGELTCQRRPRLRCSAWNRVVAWTVALAPAMAHVAGTR